MNYKEKFNLLIKEFNEDKDIMYLLENSLLSYPNYVQARVEAEMMIPLCREKYEGESLIYHIERLDSARRQKHNFMIDSTNKLNRLLISIGVEPLCTIDQHKPEYREEYAALALEINSCYFNSRDLSKIKEELHNHIENDMEER